MAEIKRVYNSNTQVASCPLSFWQNCSLRPRSPVAACPFPCRLSQELPRDPHCQGKGGHWVHRAPYLHTPASAHDACQLEVAFDLLPNLLEATTIGTVGVDTT